MQDKTQVNDSIFIKEFAKKFKLTTLKKSHLKTELKKIQPRQGFSLSVTPRKLESEESLLSSLQTIPISEHDISTILNCPSHIKMESIFDIPKLNTNIASLKLVTYRYLAILDELTNNPTLLENNEAVIMSTLSFLQNVSKKLDRYSFRLQQVYGNLYTGVPMFIQNTISNVLSSTRSLFKGENTSAIYALSLKRDIDHLNFVIKNSLLSLN